MILLLVAVCFEFLTALDLRVPVEVSVRILRGTRRKPMDRRRSPMGNGEDSIFENIGLMAGTGIIAGL